MKRKLAATITVALAVFMVHFAIADQLDNEAAAANQRAVAGAPAAIMVKVDPTNKTVEVYRVPKIDQSVLRGTAAHAVTEAVIRATEVPANNIARFTTATNELDATGSTQACWYGGWYNSGYSWNNWGGYSYPYSYSYYPTYYYYPSYYNWYYPYSYPGYFSYSGYYNYNYYGSYPYYGCNYGWYY